MEIEWKSTEAYLHALSLANGLYISCCSANVPEHINPAGSYDIECEILELVGLEEHTEVVMDAFDNFLFDHESANKLYLELLEIFERYS